MTEEKLRDPWADAGLTIPAISFAEHRKGDGFGNAILLPTAKGDFAGAGYDVAPDIDQKTKLPRRWPSDGKIITQTVLTLLTDLHADEFMSENALKKFDEATKGGDEEDLKFIATVRKWGLRRLYLSGGSLDPESKAAIKAVGKMPVVGATIGVWIDKMEPNEHGGKTKFYRVQYALPTAATMAKVDEYLKSGAIQEGSGSAAAGAVDHGEPPF